MADLLLAVKLVLENGQYKAEIVNSEKLTKNLGTTGKQSFNDLADAAGRAPGPVGNLTRSVQGLASGASVARLAITGVVGAIGLFVIGVAKGTVVAGEHERQLRRLEAQIRATGGAAGKSAQQLDEQSGALARSTLFSDDEIRAAQSRLLTFTSVSGAMFDRALRGATDLASVMEGGLSGAVVTLGKALEDPEEGLTALGRAGIKFSDAQKKVIKDLAETGEKGAALAKVLEVIEGKIGGVAAAEAQGYSDAIHDLAEGWEDLLESLGNTAVFTRATRELSNLVDAARRFIAPTDSEQFNELIQKRLALTDTIAAMEASSGSGVYSDRQLESTRANLRAVNSEIAALEKKGSQEQIENTKREEEAASQAAARELEDRKRAAAEKGKITAKANAEALKAENELREQMLSDDQDALERGLEARQIALKTEVETAQAELQRSHERKLISDEQYFAARHDLVEASFDAEIDLRERLLLIAAAKEQSVITAQIEDLKAKRRKALQDTADDEAKFQQKRFDALQGRVSGAVTRASQSATAVDARVSTGALTQAQGRGALGEIAERSRAELQALRAELLALLDATPNDPAVLELLGQVQGALRDARTEAEILGDRIVGTLTGGVTDALTDAATGAKSFGDAFKDAGASIVNSITRIVTELLVLAAVQQIVGIATGGAYTISGGQLTATGKASGGYISGPGSGTSDSIPARLSNGEYVVKAASVSRFGRGFFDALNAGFAPSMSGRGFAAGGYVGPTPASSGGGPMIQIINQGEPMKASKAESGSTPDGRDLYRIFVEPELRRDIANNGPVTQQLSSTLGLSRSPSRR